MLTGHNERREEDDGWHEALTLMRPRRFAVYRRNKVRFGVLFPEDESGRMTANVHRGGFCFVEPGDNIIERIKQIFRGDVIRVEILD